MTNHSGETCLKHIPDTEWTDTELYIDLAPEVSHRITAREGVLTNRLQMKAGEIVGLKELLSSHTTYWKERVRKEVEGMKRKITFNGSDESGFIQYGQVIDSDCEYNQALDTLLDNLK